jgi:DNA-binding NarL/FixJ family response regulator
MRRVPLTVVIAEDNYIVREGVERLLGAAGLAVVATCGTYDDLLALVAEHDPDAVVTDIRMPPTHTDEGVRAAIEIRRTHPRTGVVVLSQHASPAYASALLRGDSTGLAYLLKDRVSDVEQLVAALRVVSTGGSMIDPLIVEELIATRSASSRSGLSDLTPREAEILREMAQGKSNAAIAASVYLNERSVEKYINSIFSKLHLADEPNVNRRVKAVLIHLTSGGG